MTSSVFVIAPAIPATQRGNGLAAFDPVSDLHDQLIYIISNDADAYTRHDRDHGAPHVSAVSADRNERAEYEGGHTRVMVAFTRLVTPNTSPK